jgi:DNA gyrase/topoisomerase IV subunit B
MTLAHHFPQDHDGSHIKGLLINFLDHFFPSLLTIPNFLVEFVTPIVRVCLQSQDKLDTNNAIAFV